MKKFIPTFSILIAAYGLVEAKRKVETRDVSIYKHMGGKMEIRPLDTLVSYRNDTLRIRKITVISGDSVKVFHVIGFLNNIDTAVDLQNWLKVNWPVKRLGFKRK